MASSSQPKSPRRPGTDLQRCAAFKYLLIVKMLLASGKTTVGAACSTPAEHTLSLRRVHNLSGDTVIFQKLIVRGAAAA